MSTRKVKDQQNDKEASRMDEPAGPQRVGGKGPDRRFIENREDLQEIHRQRKEEGKE